MNKRTPLFLLVAVYAIGVVSWLGGYVIWLYYVAKDDPPLPEAPQQTSTFNRSFGLESKGTRPCEPSLSNVAAAPREGAESWPKTSTSRSIIEPSRTANADTNKTSTKVMISVADVSTLNTPDLDRPATSNGHATVDVHSSAMPDSAGGRSTMRTDRVGVSSNGESSEASGVSVRARPLNVGSHRTAPSSMALASSPTDCRPSADTKFSTSAQSWIDTANRWYADILSKYPRSISRAYDVLRCNGSIPYGWYSTTHIPNPFDPSQSMQISDETPTEWMCRMGWDSPLASIMVRTAPTMRPPGSKATSVRLTYNSTTSASIDIGPASAYWTCGHVGEQPCVLSMIAPCERPIGQAFAGASGKPVAVVSGWDVMVPPVIHPRVKKD